MLDGKCAIWCRLLIMVCCWIVEKYFFLTLYTLVIICTLNIENCFILGYTSNMKQLQLIKNPLWCLHKMNDIWSEIGFSWHKFINIITTLIPVHVNARSCAPILCVMQYTVPPLVSECFLFLWNGASFFTYPNPIHLSPFYYM